MHESPITSYLRFIDLLVYLILVEVLSFTGPIGPDVLREHLVARLCHKFDFWHSLAHHLVDEFTQVTFLKK
eukprot:SAG11_NODE_2175_length_3718_cov_3.873169_1_plen_70_part_10